MNQIVNMLARVFTRQATNWSINKGVDWMAKSGSKTGKPNPDEARASRANAKRLRRAVDLISRMKR